MWALNGTTANNREINDAVAELGLTGAPSRAGDPIANDDDGLIGQRLARPDVQQLPACTTTRFGAESCGAAAGVVAERHPPGEVFRSWRVVSSQLQRFGLSRLTLCTGSHQKRHSWPAAFRPRRNNGKKQERQVVEFSTKVAPHRSAWPGPHQVADFQADHVQAAQRRGDATNS